jgi:hypothetical protein
MKTLLITFLCSIGVTVLAQTNLIELNHKPARFTDLKGKEYDVRLVRANRDGVIYSMDGGGGMLRYTNLPPQVAASWGIPADWISNASQRDKAKVEADARWKATYTSRAAQITTHRDFQMALTRAKAVYDQQRQAADSDVKAIEGKINGLRAQIANDTARRNMAWNRYVYLEPGFWSIAPDGTAYYVNTEAGRLAYARELDQAIASAQEQLWSLEKDLQKAKDAYLKELEKIDQGYREEVTRIQEQYEKVSAAITTTKTP